MYIKFPKEQKDQIIAEIQGFFLEEKGEEIGLIAAENIFDFFMERLGPILYNQGVKDAKKLVTQLLLNIEEDIASLERPIQRKL
ncbi:uncharacterized protein SAMN05877753_10129 [Bacillus oleivorans]|uniref:DUF2164 domain-containing protein n=1 Tax=Bacillus oleivorans TaxID=1448271 RepID=A0A285CI75_9BACI|nr:DUF2164 domain-containing protein [Bacillus oleivorans]SNX66718.1 uncharacterized protein SAMN05877753_10129 [Bacillus oleivorans]